MRKIDAARRSLRSACLFSILLFAMAAVSSALAVAPPGHMAAPTANGGALRAQVSWNPPQDGGAPVAYTVRASSGQSASCSAPCTSLELPLPPDSYTFTVTPENAGGPGPESGASNTVAVVKDDVVVATTVGPGLTAYVPYTVSVAVDAVTSGSYTPTGRIDVSDGNGGTCSIVSLVAGSGRCDLVSTSPLLLTLTAVYDGDVNFNGGGGTLTVLVLPPTIVPAPQSLPAGAVGAAYAETRFGASGGTPPYTYAVNGGTLPAGLALAADGGLSGTPRDGGTFDFVVLAKDAHGFPGTQAYTLTVAAPALALTPDVLPAAAAETAYTHAFATSGGTGPYTYAVSDGALPTGLQLSAGGELSGSALAAGTFTFRVRSTDSSGGSGPYSVERPYSLEVAAPTITLAPDGLPPGRSGVAYPATAFAAAGGVAPYTYAVESGGLPAGLRLGSDGQLSGTPSAGGTFTFQVRATDAHAFGGSRSYTIAVDAPTLTLSPSDLPSAQVGRPYSQAFATDGGVAPYTYALAGGALPGGLQLTPAGVLLGTPLAAGSFAFSVRSTDASSGAGPYSTTRDYTLAVSAAGTSVLLASSGSPSRFGQAVTFTARVVAADATTAASARAGMAPAAPTGTVTFAEGAAMLAAVPLDASGTATYATSSLGVGEHVLSASYGGDAQTAPASATIVQEVLAQGAAPPIAAPALDRWALLLLAAALALVAGFVRRAR